MQKQKAQILGLVAQREDSARALLLTKDLIRKDPPVML